MQGIDAILWKHQTCDDFHKNVSYVGSTLNSSQPLLLGLLFYIYSKQANAQMLLAIGVMYLVYGLVTHFRTHEGNYYCSQPKDGDPHLVWKWTIQENRIMDWAVYLLALCLFCAYGVNQSRAIFFSASILIGFGITYLVYPRESIGSIWCFFTALTPPVYLLAKQFGYSL